MDQKKVEITISNRTVFRVLGIFILTFAILHFAQRLTYVFGLIFIAFFLALALNPAVSWLAKQLRLKSRTAATGIAYLFVVLILGTFVAVVVPPIISQTINFVREVPSSLENIQEGSGVVGRFVQRNNLQTNFDNLSQTVRARTKNLQEPVLNNVSHIGSALASVMTVFVLTFMLLAEGPDILKRYWKLHPKSHRDHHQVLADKMYNIVTAYVNGQVLISGIAAFFAMFALLVSSSIFNVSINVVAMGGIVFLFGLIPLVGNTIASVVVTAVCLFTSVPLALVMFLFFTVYQQIENVTMQPQIQAKKNELTPLLVFTATILGASLGGILGAFVAIPAAGCLKVLILDVMDTKGISRD